MWYDFIKGTNCVKIVNNYNSDITLKVTYTINCDFEETENFVIPYKETFIYDITKDGHYTYTISQSTNLADAIGDVGVGAAVPEVSVISNMAHYDYALLNIIDTLEDLFCGCDDCQNCKDCIDYDLLLKAYYKIMAFYILNRKYYQAFIDAVMVCQECDIMRQMACMIKTKFKYNTITSCIKCVDVKCIKQNIENMGLFTINSAAYINQPPAIVGDYTLNVANRSTTVLTKAMFTTATTPAYQDPEGDVASHIRIDSLPVDGQLQLNGTPVGVGDIISIADIDANLLTYVSPNQDALDSDQFNFSVNDAGTTETDPLNFTS